MNTQELSQALQFLLDPNNEIGLSMYFVLHTNGDAEIKRADISDEVRLELTSQLTEYITHTLVENQELIFQDISTADTRRNSAYYYDLDEVPNGLKVMGALLEDENRELFNFNTDTYEEIFAFVFLIGNETDKIALYKKHYPINLLKRDSILRLIKSGTRLVEVEEDIISLNEKIDFLQVEENVVVLNVRTLEKFFGFEEVIRNQAQLSLGVIDGVGFIASIEPLQEMLADSSFARKLMRVKADSPVLQLPFDRVRDFIKQHPKLRRRIRFNEGETRISLDTRMSKQLFLKLLDDDFLKSDLTQFLYETEIKNRLTNEEAAD
jgi:hypothetical protein